MRNREYSYSKGFNSNVTLPPREVFSAIRNTFQFGLTSKVEGWSPNYRYGFLFNGDYIAQGKQDTFTRPNPDRLLDVVINRVANRLRDRFQPLQQWPLPVGDLPLLKQGCKQFSDE